MPTSPEISPDWDQFYREGRTPWDKGAPAPPLLEWLQANPGALRGSVLVPGSGLGHDVRALAALPETEKVVGLDLSPTAVARAAAFPRLGAERYHVGDLLDLASEHRGTYDWVWEHTCFCAIDPARREDYVAAAHAALVPGGRLLGVFYLDPYDDEHRPGGGPPHGASLEELERRFAGSGRFAIEQSYAPRRSYPGREGLERVLKLVRR